MPVTVTKRISIIILTRTVFILSKMSVICAECLWVPPKFLYQIHTMRLYIKLRLGATQIKITMITNSAHRWISISRITPLLQSRKELQTFSFILVAGTPTIVHLAVCFYCYGHIPDIETATKVSTRRAGEGTKQVKITVAIRQIQVIYRENTIKKRTILNTLLFNTRCHKSRKQLKV